MPNFGRKLRRTNLGKTNQPPSVFLSHWAERFTFSSGSNTFISTIGLNPHAFLSFASPSGFTSSCEAELERSESAGMRA
jgi:hypothetical protein